MLISADGIPRQELSTGERKSIATDRVVLIPGPAAEVSWVREIYRLFISENKTFAGIAAELDQRGAPFLKGKRWSDHAVKRILTHPKYKGTAIYNRTTEKLCSKSRKVPASEWIVVPNAFEPLVEPTIFEVAQETLRQKFWHRSNEQVLEQLKAILKAHGRLSTGLLRVYGLSPGGLNHRFGSMIKAYDRIGYHTMYKKTAEHRLHVRKIRSELMQQLVDMFPGRMSVFSWAWRRRNCLRLMNGMTVAVRVCRSIKLVTKGRMWVLQAARDERCRITLMAGMNPENTALETFYLTTRLKNPCKIHITENSEWLKSGVRLVDLRSFYEVVMTRESDSRS
jgi:hypothetical protein